MLVGNKLRFAIEQEVTADGPGRDASIDLVFGHCCFWAGGVRLGDFEYLQRTRFLLVACEAMLEHMGNRDSAKLSALSRDELTSVLDEMLYGGRDCTLEEIRRRTQLYWRHNLLPQGVEAFDGGWRIYLVENSEHARLLHRDPAGTIGEMVLRPGEVDAVLQGFVDWFLEAYPCADPL